MRSPFQRTMQNEAQHNKLHTQKAKINQHSPEVWKKYAIIPPAPNMISFLSLPTARPERAACIALLGNQFIFIKYIRFHSFPPSLSPPLTLPGGVYPNFGIQEIKSIKVDAARFPEIKRGKICHEQSNIKWNGSPL